MTTPHLTPHPLLPQSFPSSSPPKLRIASCLFDVKPPEGPFLVNSCCPACAPYLRRLGASDQVSHVYARASLDIVASPGAPLGASLYMCLQFQSQIFSPKVGATCDHVCPFPIAANVVDGKNNLLGFGLCLHISMGVTSFFMFRPQRHIFVAVHIPPNFI